MARKKETTAEAVKNESTKSNTESKAKKSDVPAQTSTAEEANSVQANTQAQPNRTATVDLHPQYSALNIREKPNGEIVGTLKNGVQVTVHRVDNAGGGETWAQIGENQFVNMAFLKTE